MLINYVAATRKLRHVCQVSFDRTASVAPHLRQLGVWQPMIQYTPTRRYLPYCKARSYVYTQDILPTSRAHLYSPQDLKSAGTHSRVSQIGTACPAITVKVDAATGTTYPHAGPWSACACSALDMPTIALQDKVHDLTFNAAHSRLLTSPRSSAVAGNSSTAS